MKQRVVSALIGLGILAVVLLLLDTLVFNIVMGFIGVLAVLELLNAVKCIKFRGLSALSVAMAAAIPFAQEAVFRRHMPQTIFLFVLVFFLILLKNYGTLRVEQAAMMFFFSIVVPVFFSCAVYIRNDFGPVIGVVYLLWALGSGWFSDTGAYFVGNAIGKRKLAPRISPKKTVEGAIGGILTACAGMCLIFFSFQLVMRVIGIPVSVNYFYLLLLTPIFACAGILGDLSASVIKRQFGVKDFGHIMPGHGGILDRFDSVMFTLPSVFIVVQHIAIISYV